MLRLFLRSISINLASVYIAAQILSGVVVYVGGWYTLFVAALAIATANLFIRPLVNLLLLPINLVTLGFFRWAANLIILFLVTRIVPSLQIQPFTFSGLNLTFIIIPPIHFSIFGAFIVATLTLTVIFHFLYWLLQD